MSDEDQSPDLGGIAMERSLFEEMYQHQPPWETGRPQTELVRLHQAGEIKGSVLDVGCGTGENALYLAQRGHEAWGIDFVPAAIAQAERKARERGLAAHFEVRDALELGNLGRTFDTVIDSGLFHTFDDAQRARFVDGLARVLNPGGAYHVLCFSDQEPPGEGPRRISQEELRAAFRTGWEISAIRPARFDVADLPEGPKFSPGGPRAWLATIVRRQGQGT